MPFAPPPSSRPLSLEETNALRVNTVMPVVVILIIMAIALVMTMFMVLPLWDRPLVKVFASVVGLLLTATAIAVWMHVRNNLGDLRDGVAQVRSGRLLSKRQTGRAPYTFYATIEGTGEVIVWGSDYANMTEQSSYTVAFSPRTRRAWSVAPVS
jgi:Kef-type K+ transport system membrane component KefB